MLRNSFTALFKNATQTRRRQQRKKRTTRLEALESRLVLSAVSLEAGTLAINADLGNDDVVNIEDTGSDTLRITVGGTDTFVLDAAITADPAFTLSAGNTVLDVNLAAAGIIEAEFNLNDGNDFFIATSVPDTLLLAINGGEGDDTVEATSATGSVVVAGGQGNDVLSTGSGNDTLIGGAGDDTLIGGTGDDIIDGEAGDDIIEGGGGTDNIEGGEDNDTLIGGTGDDIIDGGAGDDTLICLLYTSPSPRDQRGARMPSSA